MLIRAAQRFDRNSRRHRALVLPLAMENKLRHGALLLLPLAAVVSSCSGGRDGAIAGWNPDPVASGPAAHPPTAIRDAGAASAAFGTTTPPEPAAHGGAGCQDHDEDDSPELRRHAARRIGWQHPRRHPRGEAEVPVKILGLNDFHGQLSPKVVAGRPAGGAAVLVSYLQAAARTNERGAIIAHAGDHVGASPPNSALLQDEPAIAVLNRLANQACSYENKLNPLCNLVGTLGNHEFDEGRGELLRLIEGGNSPSGPFLESPWRGARFPYVSANVIDQVSGTPLLAPFLVKRVQGLPIGFIGAVLKETPTIVTPAGVAGLTFADEATEINRSVESLHAQGVRAIVVQIHQGGSQASFVGPTDAGTAAPSGAILDIVNRLDDDIDVVISGHTHQFTNALVPNAHGVPILVTQAFSASTAYDDIELVLDQASRDVVEKSASIVTTWADEGPGLAPDSEVTALVAQADARVAPLVNRVVGEASVGATRDQNAAGESALGDLIADSQRAAVSADFAFMNPGGIRADLPAGTVTWGTLFTIQPFGNTVTKLAMTGQQIIDVLNQQWGPPQPAGGRVLQISGLGYTWDATVPEGGNRVVEVHDAAGVPLSITSTYVVAANNFIAGGGDNFTRFAAGTKLEGGPVDLDALVVYVQTLAQPFRADRGERIRRLP